MPCTCKIVRLPHSAAQQHPLGLALAKPPYGALRRSLCSAGYGLQEALRLAEVDGWDWLLHIDPDELFHPGGPAASIPGGAPPPVGLGRTAMPWVQAARAQYLEVVLVFL